MFHAEMIPPISASVGDDVQWSLPPLAPSGPLDSYQTFLSSRPPAFETYAISQILSLSHLAPQLPLHIVHLSALEAIPLLRKARECGVNITAETCFHYLSLAAENIKAGDTRHKCCPPIREKANQEALWAELTREDSVIKTVVSDHSPCTPELKLLPPGVDGAVAVPNKADKAGDFFSAWGGVSSVGLGLSILWTELQSRSRDTSRTATQDLLDISRWCAKHTAAQIGLSHRKGELKVGMDADIAVFDPEGSWVVEPNTMLFRNKCSPYQGMRLKGVVKETWVRGRKVHSREEGFGKIPEGNLILEPRVA